MQVHQRYALNNRPCHLAHVIARWSLNLDDFGTEVDEVRSQRCRAEQRQVEDPNACK